MSIKMSINVDKIEEKSMTVAGISYEEETRYKGRAKCIFAARPSAHICAAANVTRIQIAKQIANKFIELRLLSSGSWGH